jgi:DNA repair protein RadA/Sms
MLTYNYTNQFGEIIGVKQRRDFTDKPKEIYWTKSLTKAVPYRLYDLVKSKKDYCFLLEGEKCVDRFREFVGGKYPATSMPNGANVDHTALRWFVQLKIKKVIIIPDNDVSGENFAKEMSVELLKMDIQSKIVKLKGLYPGEDFVEWVDVHRQTLPLLMGHVKNAPIIQMPSQKLMRMSDVEAEEVSWIWKNRIPKGFLSVIFGMPGTMKSYLTISLAVAGSVGKGLPLQEEFEPFNSLFLLGEDSARGVLLDRLNKFKDKNLDRIFAFDEGISFDPNGIQEIKKMIVENNIKMCVVDPLNAFFPAYANTSSDNEIREILSELILTCRERDCALVAISHMNKGQMSETIYRLSGSSGIPALCRSIYLVGKVKEELMGKGVYHRSFLVHVKSNLSMLTPTIEFKVREDGSFEWLEQSSYDESDILRGET